MVLNAPGCRIADRGVPWIPVIPGPIDAVDRSRVAVRSRSDDGGPAGSRVASAIIRAKPFVRNLPAKILPHPASDCHGIVELRLDLDVLAWSIPFASIPTSRSRAKPERSWRGGYRTTGSATETPPMAAILDRRTRTFGSGKDGTPKVYGRLAKSPVASQNTRKTSRARLPARSSAITFGTLRGIAQQRRQTTDRRLRHGLPTVPPPLTLGWNPENISALPDQNQPSGLSTFTPTLRVLLVMTG